MIYVQHLLGIGHFRRASILADTLAKHQFEVTLVTGGLPVAGRSLAHVNLYQLPPVRSLDSSFDQLVDERNNAIDDKWKLQRCGQLLALFERLSPDILITETFPFGRRMMRFELIPLLKAARRHAKPPLIVASIRDILQPKSKKGRDQEICEWIDQYYDRILVHGDEKIASLADTFSLASEIANKTFYTGYICEPANKALETSGGENEVLVSGGGGAASLPLLKTAIAAKALSSLNHEVWRLLVGPNIDQPNFHQLQQSAGKGIIVERNRSDFPGLLKRCTVSVSQAGYNTVMDILTSGTRSVLVPFSEAGEVEQTLRATLLARQRRVVALAESDLTPEALAASIDQAMKLPPQAIEFKMEGAEVSSQLLDEWLDGG